MSKEINSFLTGLAVGAAAGAVAGVLLAPKSGAETREDLKKVANEMKDKVQDTYSSAKKSLERKMQAVKKLGGKIDEKKYAELVEEIISEYKEKDLLTSESAKSLGKQLKNDWTSVKKAVSA